MPRQTDFRVLLLLPIFETESVYSVKNDKIMFYSILFLCDCFAYHPHNKTQRFKLPLCVLFISLSSQIDIEIHKNPIRCKNALL